MSAESLADGLVVLLVGAAMCVTPVLTRPTVQFGVQVPEGRSGAPVIVRERRAYYWRTGVLAVCFAVAVVVGGGLSPWVMPVLLLLELAAGFGCFLLARERITAVKRAEGWFEGLRQTVTADTTWRTDPPRFPWLWVLPTVAVLVATAVVGVVRYPGLPDRIAVHFTAGGTADRWSGKSVWSAFSPVFTQLFVALVVIGLALLTFRSRPELEAGDAHGSALRYRVFVVRVVGALLALVALVEVGLLLLALQTWGVYRLTGAAAVLPLLPILLGVLLVMVAALRTGQAGSRLAGGGNTAGGGVAVANRDDDHYWKAGLIYVNRNDPALLVGKRFGVGWTLNVANPRAWLLLAVIVGAAVAFGAVLR